MRTTRRLLAATLLAAAVAGCTTTKATSSAGSTSPAGDLSASALSSSEANAAPTLLPAATDVPIDGLALTSYHGDAQSVVGRYETSDGTQSLVDTIVLFPSAAAAQAALTGTEDAAAQSMDGPSVRDVIGGKVYSGTSSSDFLVSVVFTQGRALATLALRSNAAITDAVVDAVIAKQAALIKTNVH